MNSHITNFFIITSLLSCGSPRQQAKKDTKVVAVDTTKTYQDTVIKFVVDDYPVTTEMLEENRKKQGEVITHGKIHTGEEIWFLNPSSRETLMYALGTDYYRMRTFCFLNVEVPDDLIDQIDFITEDAEMAPLALKRKYLKDFIAGASKLEEKYFTTNKGFRLGDSKTKILQHLGKPDTTSSSNNIEKYVWEFVGDGDVNDKSVASKGKPVAEDSFGHQINMYFKKEKLIAIIYHNDVP